MSAIAERRRRRTFAALLTGLAGILVLPAGLVLGADKLLNQTGGDNVDNRPTTRIPSTPTAMVAVTNSRNEVSALAVLALDPSGRGGSIVSVPVGANAEIPKSGTIHRVADSYSSAVDAASGLAALRADVEGLLNVSFSHVDDLDAVELGTLLAGVSAVEVNLPAPVVDSRQEGGPTEVLPAGESTISGSDIGAGLASSQDGVAESARLPAVKELWRAVASGASTGPATSDSAVPAGDGGVEAPADTAGYFAALLSGPVQVWQLGATLLTDPARNPGNADLYELDGGEVIMVMASVAPSAIALVSNSIAVMIDTPYDDSSLVREAVLRLAYAGANVVVVRTVAETPREETEVFYNDEPVRNDLQQYVSLMGDLSYTLTDEVIEGVNARIVLGENFRRFIGSDAGRTIVTTTSSTVPE